MTTKTRLTALALAAATFTTALLLAGTASAKNTAHLSGGAINKLRGSAGTTTVFGQTGAPKAGGGGLISKLPPGTLKCLACVTSNAPPSQPPPSKNPPSKNPPSHGGDGYGHGPGYGWGYGRGFGHGYGYGAPIVVGGAPATVAVRAAVVAQPAVAAPVSAPVVAPTVAAPAVAEAPCNCLTKQNMPDGSLLLQDICTKESWVVAPQAVGGR